MIPANITSEWNYLEAQVAAANKPLQNNSFATIRALQLNAGNLLDDVQTALTTTTLLDTWAPITDPNVIISGFAAVVTAAQDQSNLALRRGVIGRVKSNLDQLV